MALTDLASLKAEMRDWALDRPDLVGKFQDYIDMTTNDLNKVLRTRKQQAEVILGPTIIPPPPPPEGEEEGEPTIVWPEGSVWPLPDDYLEWRSVTSLTNPRAVLVPLTPEGEVQRYPNAYGGFPANFVVENNQITILPGGEHEIELKYWRRIPHLLEAPPDDTNWLLQENANLYLFGAMKYVETYKRNMEGVQLFGQLYSGLIDGMLRDSKHAQWSRTRSRIAGRSTP